MTLAFEKFRIAEDACSVLASQSHKHVRVAIGSKSRTGFCNVVSSGKRCEVLYNARTDFSLDAVTRQEIVALGPGCTRQCTNMQSHETLVVTEILRNCGRRTRNEQPAARPAVSSERDRGINGDSRSQSERSFEQRTESRRWADNRDTTEWSGKETHAPLQSKQQCGFTGR